MIPDLINELNIAGKKVNHTTSELLLENEFKANMMLAVAMRVFSVVLALSWLLNYIGVFYLDYTSLTILVVLCVIELMTAYFVCKMYNGRREGLKYMMVGTSLLIVAEMVYLLGYHIRILIFMPILLASIYYDEKFTKSVSIASALVFLIAGVGGTATGISILDLNLVLPIGEFKNYYDGSLTKSLAELFASGQVDRGKYMFYYITGYALPTLISGLIAAMVCVHITKKGKKMLIQQEDILAKTARLDSELSLATDIQQSMLPEDFPDNDEIRIFAAMKPAKEVGGDFYDFFMVDENHLAIVIGDVSGKGIPAALFMVIAKALINDHTVPGIDPGEVFARVNNLLCKNNDKGLFVTAFEGVIDLRDGTMTYVNAGHETPFICRKGERFEPHKVKHGFVLAGMENVSFKSEQITLVPGDKIFVYSDGVPESSNLDQELYGMERVHSFLGEHSELGARDMIYAFKSELDKYVGLADQFDDVTMLCFEFKDYLKI